jgi:NAD(P)-dependent dehydrogenase (short-subunit alcohol dehydrogenase family)
MTRRFDGRVAVVFGAGAVGPGWGNGKAAAVQYARDGATVAAIDIALDAARETVDIIRGEGGSAEAWRCDVTKRAEIAAVVAEIHARYGRIDVLHNNVGLPAMGTTDSLSEAEWDHAMDVNLKSVFLTCQAVLPIMVAQGKGAIVNISSVAAIRYTGYPYPAYYASKAALNHLTASIALEYAKKGIRANAIMPGMMNTPHIGKAIVGQYASEAEMVEKRNALCPTGRMGTGWDIARAAAFLASDEADYITGQVLAVDGGLTVRC